jgi:hypothetical protein
MGIIIGSVISNSYCYPAWGYGSVYYGGGRSILRPTRTDRCTAPASIRRWNFQRNIHRNTNVNININNNYFNPSRAMGT